MSEKSDWEQGYDQARRRFYGERKVLTARIAELEKALNIDTDLTIAGLRKELRDATARIAELEMKIRHNALWQASEDAEERAHLEKLVLDLKKRIAELEAIVEQLIWVGNDLLIDNANPVTVVLFNGLVAKAKEKERSARDERIETVSVLWR